MIVFVAEHHKGGVECIVLSPDEKTFASISEFMHICDSETGHCILGPFQLTNLESPLFAHTNACFSPDGKHILVRYRPYNDLLCCAVVWDIERGEEVFEIECFDCVFIHCGHNEGRIASMDWIDEDENVIQTVTLTDSEDEDGSSIRTIASKDQRSTRILVKLWDIRNSIFQSLFEVTGVTVTEFSPNGQYLAVGRRSESVVLWSLEDGKITHQFLHPPGKLLSLYFSLTGDCLMAAFWGSHHQCLWRLDTQQMVSFDLDVAYMPPTVIHSSHTNYVFVARGRTVEIWEVSTTGLNMVFKIESSTTYSISSICPSRDGHRLLIGSYDGIVKMWNLEDLGSNQPVTQDDTVERRIIKLSPSGNIAVAVGFSYIELWDTATRELVGPRDIERDSQVVFSTDDNRIAVVSGSLVTIWDINHTNHLSFNTCPKGKSVLVRGAAFQTRDDLVICAELDDDDSHEISGLLQVWKLKDHSECIFSLDVDINSPYIMLASEGLTLITQTSCYSWNHDTAQFHPFHFADEAYLDGSPMMYSPDGKLLASWSRKDDNVRVWDTRTGQLCGKPITMSVTEIALSPALNDRFLGDRLIALRCWSTVSLLHVNTGHLYVRFCGPGSSRLAFIRDGTKLVFYDPTTSDHPTRIYDIADLAAKHQNATKRYELVIQDTGTGWMVGEDNELLFWVPSEHRRLLCLPHTEMILERPTNVDLSHFKFGTKWTKCIDQSWLEEIKEKGQRFGKLLG